MPALTRTVSKAAAAEVYDDLKELVDRTARRFARKYNRDFRECRANALTYFMEAYLSHDPDRGTDLEQRVVFLVWKGLLTETRLAAQRKLSCPRVFRDFGRMASRVEPEFDLEDFLADFGPDAREVIETVLNSPPELEEMIHGEDPEHPDRHLKLSVRSYFQEVCRWSVRRVDRAFREIHDLL